MVMTLRVSFAGLEFVRVDDSFAFVPGVESRTTGAARLTPTSGLPQILQKPEPGGGFAPQLEQMSASLDPHSLQKVEPSGG